jgi:predicted Zn-dependent protease
LLKESTPPMSGRTVAHLSPTGLTTASWMWRSRQVSEAHRAERLRPDAIQYRLAAAAADAAGPFAHAIDNALRDIDAGLAVSPNDRVLRDQRSQLLLERDQQSGQAIDVTAARRYLERLVAADPVNAGLQLPLGAAAALGGDDATAESAQQSLDQLAGDPTYAVNALTVTGSHVVVTIQGSPPKPGGISPSFALVGIPG